MLKLNAELKKQNEKLKQDKLNAEQEAEATVSSVKREYEAKGRELDRRIGEAAKQSASLKSERQSISEDIEQRATAKYLDQKKELDRKFKAQTASYDSFLLGLLLYGVLTTVFTAVRSEAFVSDFKTFFMVIWQFIVNAFQLLLKGGQWASQLGDKIPQPVVAILISTSSIALQSAIQKEYLPLLSSVLLSEGLISAPIEAVIRKGKAHYACDARLERRVRQVEGSHKNPAARQALHTAWHVLDLDQLSGMSSYDRGRICVPKRCNCRRKDCRYHSALSSFNRLCGRYCYRCGLSYLPWSKQGV